MATVYFSKRCQYCGMFLEKLDLVPDVAATITAVCVEEKGAPGFVRTVPAVVDGQSLYQGKDAFAWLKSKKETALTPFVYDAWGPSPTTTFSFYDKEDGHAHRQDAFTAVSDAEDTAGHTVQPQGLLDSLIEQRKADVPQAIQRT